MNEEQALALLDELTLPEARGGRKPAGEFTLDVVRELEASDLALLASARPTAPVSLVRMRASHHQLARLLALGEGETTAGLMTGYSPAWISSLKSDPTFQELVAYYAGQEELRFADVRERMTTLGLSSLDEIQHRLEESPDDWTKQQLMDLAELMLVKPLRAGAQAPGGGNSGGPGIAIQVSFVGGQGGVQSSPGIIDVKAE